MADQDFEQLLKTVQQLNQQLAELASKATTAKNALKGGSQNELSFAGLQGLNIGNDILRKANELNSAISEAVGAIQNQLLKDAVAIREAKQKIIQNAQNEILSYNNTLKQPPVAATPTTTPGGVLGRLTPESIQALKDSELEKQRALQKVLQNAQNELSKLTNGGGLYNTGASEAYRNQVQNQLLQEAIAKRQSNITAYSNRFGLSNADYARAAGFPTQGGTNPNVTEIHHPGVQQIETAEDLYAKALRNAAKEIDNRARIIAEGKAEEIKARAELNAAGYQSDPTTILRGKLPADFSTFAEDKRSQQQVIEEEALNSLKGRVQAEKKYAQALEQATAQGFGIEDLRRAETRGVAGIERLQFQRYDEGGTLRRFDTFVNPSGKATPGISNQFRTFGQGVLRDIGEFTKWSIALAAVYGPMRKLSELVQEMISNQAKLADAVIAVNSSFTDQSKIFDIATKSADQAGEAVGGVIDAFTAAYRATGGVGDQVTRLATAQKLLNDALTLSKLSTLDQASAIDTLSAAVRQTGGDFNKTTELLDSWVRVTKVANVDLATLATGFATVGDAANTAGLSADDLNGILAVLAESTKQSGQEVANTSRAIIAGFQSDQGTKALEALGIATRTSTGELRSLKDVMQEVAALSKSGIISKGQLSDLALQIGGGTRRGAVVTTFIQNYSRALDVAEESSRANGDAQAALAKQLETVQTATARLGNSFSSLAQTMGNEGGFLSIMKNSIDATAGLVNVFDKLVGLLGKATPAMAAFIATSLILKQQGRGGIQQALFGEGQKLVTGELDYRLIAAGQGLSAGRASPEQKLNNFLGEGILGKGAIGGLFQGALVSALPAILNATNKTDKYGGTKAAADVIGGIGGGVVGALVAGSPVIGAAVGTAISEAFVNSTIARQTDFFAYNTRPAVGEKAQNLSTEEGRNQALQDAVSGLYKSIGGGNESRGKFLTSGAEKTAQTLVDQINQAIKTQDKDALGRVFAGRGGTNKREFLSSLGITPEVISSAFAAGKPIEAKPELAAYIKASPEAQKAYDVVLAAITAIQDSKGISTPFTRQIEENRNKYGNVISGITTQSRNNLTNQRIAGDVTGAEYARRADALGGYSTKALEYYTALGDEFIKVDKNVNSAADAFQAFNTIIVNGAADSVPELTAIVGEIEDLTNILNDPKLQTQDALEKLGFKNLSEVSDKLKELKTTGAGVLEDVFRQSQLTDLKGRIPNIAGDISKPLTSQENQLVVERTKQLQDSFYQGFLKFDNSQYDALKKSFDDFAVTIKDSGEEFYQKITETDQQFRQASIQQLQEEGKIRSQQNFGIQQLDITSAQGAGLQGQIDYFSQYLTKNFPQYKQNPEDVGVIFSDYVTSVLHGDNLAIKLALEKIVDLNQKQLDGMYNIPEGATFWVPLQAAYYRPKDQGGLGDLGGGAASSNTQALDANTKALQDMALAFRGDTGQSRQAQELKNAALGYRGDLGYSRKAEADRQAALGYRGDLGFSRQQPTSFLDQLNNWLTKLFGEFGQGGAMSASHGGVPTYPGTTGGRTMENVAPQPIQARLDLRFDNSVQLIVDGRVLASVVTPYLATDLIKMEASQGTITKRYVI